MKVIVITFLTVSIFFSSCFLSKKSSEVEDTSEFVEEVEKKVALEAFSVTYENATPQDIQKGSEIFAENCARCHGKMAQGKGAPNLLDAHAIYNPSFANMKLIIANGTEHMPSYKNKLSDNDIARVTAYIHTLFGTVPEGAKGPQGKQW